MTAYQFTFSNQVKPRLLRHLFFWIAYYTYTFLINLPGINSKILSDPELYKSVLTEATIYLPVYIFSVYTTLYFILPRYLANRNFLFLLLSMITLLAVTLYGSYLITLNWVIDKSSTDIQDLITVAGIKGLSEQAVITGSALIVKTSKDYYLRDEAYQKLTVQRIYNQLEMMKLKIEPTILLGVLKNIHTDINNGGRHASQMILLLSDLLSYILYETDANLVPLKKEINMLIHYTRLKELTYGNRLKLAIQISGEIKDQMVAPLVLLPLIELAIPQEMDHPNDQIISEIDIYITEPSLIFSAKNNLPCPGIKNPGAQIILENAIQNLQVNYPGRHLLKSEDSAPGFTAHLELTLNNIPRTELVLPGNTFLV